MTNIIEKISLIEKILKEFGLKNIHTSLDEKEAVKLTGFNKYELWINEIQLDLIIDEEFFKNKKQVKDVAKKVKKAKYYTTIFKKQENFIEIYEVVLVNKKNKIAIKLIEEEKYIENIKNLWL